MSAHAGDSGELFQIGEGQVEAQGSVLQAGFKVRLCPSWRCWGDSGIIVLDVECDLSHFSDLSCESSACLTLEES